MKVLVARVLRASLKAESGRAVSIARGIVLFIGIERDDSEVQVVEMANRIVNMRIFENEQGKLYYSAQDKGYEILCVPNFTLCASTERGRRPSFDEAMEPEAARRMFENFARLLSSYDIGVQSGMFGEHMEIELVLDGPLNIVIESHAQV